MSKQGQYTFRLETDIQELINRVVDRSRLKKADIVRGFVERGLWAYVHDGFIFEPGWNPKTTPEEILAKFEGRPKVPAKPVQVFKTKDKGGNA